MSEPLTTLTSNLPLVHQRQEICDCKTVLLRFSCGHDFVRTQHCDNLTDSRNGTGHPRRKLILQTRNLCAECDLMTDSAHDQVIVEVIVGELSEHGSPPKNKVIDGDCKGDGNGEFQGSISGQEQYTRPQVLEGEFEWSPAFVDDSAVTVIHHEPVDLMSYADTYQLPAESYGPFTPGDPSTPNDQDQDPAFDQQHQVTNCIGEANDFFNIEPSASDQLFDWLQSEILQSPEDTQLQRGNEALVNAISPLQYLDDPYDTSASSCARTSDGTIRRYEANLDESPAIESWLESLSRSNSPRANQVRQLNRTQSLSWPIVPVVHVTKQGPQLSMFGKSGVPKQSLTKRVRSSISKTYQVISTKLFRKRGIDGREMQKRHSIAISFQSLRRFSSRRSGSRAERKADELRTRMLRKRYAESGYFKVVAGGKSWSEFSDSVRSRDVSDGPKEKVLASEGGLEEESDVWVTSSVELGS